MRWILGCTINVLIGDCPCARNTFVYGCLSICYAYAATSHQNEKPSFFHAGNPTRRTLIFAVVNPSGSGNRQSMGF
ncbi:MAG: hypothetical protein RLZ35_64 [Pseudomonadota bacterium]|jgi:hypothetical protein